MSIFLGIIVILSALVLVLTVLFQSSNAKGLGAIAGEAETYFGKNKGKAIDAKLALGTNLFSDQPTLMETLGSLEALNQELAYKSLFYEEEIAAEFLEEKVR